ncbi:MAG: hypothetical protein AB2448_13035 [Moorella sp. (in: firmicutes)]
MLAIINSVVLVGLEGQGVRVEVDISNGLPVCESVGQIVYTKCLPENYRGLSRSSEIFGTVIFAIFKRFAW